MSERYGFAHLVNDLAGGAISETTVREKLRLVARYELLDEADIREMVCMHFAAEPAVEELLRLLRPSVLKLTGLDALVVPSGLLGYRRQPDDSALADPR
ncbi:MAG: hypothetical protein ACREGE_00825 [Candidatus Microsaccharimonas sp.]